MAEIMGAVHGSIRIFSRRPTSASRHNNHAQAGMDVREIDIDIWGLGRHHGIGSPFSASRQVQERQLGEHIA